MLGAVTHVVVHLVTSDHPWRFDLASLAAIVAGVGTVLLALFTWRLAAETRRLAIETGEDVRAEWRPVLTSDDSATLVFRHEIGERVNPRALYVRVDNRGRGPALTVSASAVMDGGILVEDVDRQAVLDVGASVLLDFNDLSLDVPATASHKLVAVVSYKDLAGQPHMTRLSYEFRLHGGLISADAGETTEVEATLMNIEIDPEEG